MILQNILVFLLFFLYFHWTGKIGTMSSHELITYYLLLLAFFSNIIPTVDISFFEKLRYGGLDSIMVLPVNLNGYFVAMHLELLAFKLLINLIIFSVVAVVIHIIFPTFLSLFQFLIAFIASMLLYFEFRVFFTQFAYYVERPGALSFWSYYLFLFLSGGLLPLNLFPDSLRRILFLTPFPYLIDYPIGIWLGKYAISVKYLAITAFYALLMLFVNKGMERKGIKRYAGYGG